MRICRNCKTEFKARAGLGLCRRCWNDPANRAKFDPVAPFGGAQAARMSNGEHLMAVIQEVFISAIQTGAQTRATLNEDAVESYREPARENRMPPVVVFYDETNYFLADGHHTIAAHKLENLPTVKAEVRPGTLRDAVLFACGANATHGVPRTTQDKANAVRTLLADPEWKNNSTHWIAQQCRVSDYFVDKLRTAQVNGNSQDGPSTSRAGSSTKKPKPGDACEDEPRKGRDGKDRPARKPNAPSTSRAGSSIGEVLKDREGTLLPKGCRDAWSDATLPNLLAEMDGILNVLNVDGWVKLVGSLAAHYPFITFAAFAESLRNAKLEMELCVGSLKAGLPHAVCPKCKGVNSRDNGHSCQTCRGSGLVPEHRWHELQGGAA